MIKYIIKNKNNEWLDKNYDWQKFINIDECYLHSGDSLPIIKNGADKDNWELKPVEAFEVKILKAPTGEVKRL